MFFRQVPMNEIVESFKMTKDTKNWILAFNHTPRNPSLHGFAQVVQHCRKETVSLKFSREDGCPTCMHLDPPGRLSTSPSNRGRCWTGSG